MFKNKEQGAKSKEDWGINIEICWKFSKNILKIFEKIFAKFLKNILKISKKYFVNLEKYFKNFKRIFL